MHGEWEKNEDMTHPPEKGIGGALVALLFYKIIMTWCTKKIRQLTSLAFNCPMSSVLLSSPMTFSFGGQPQPRTSLPPTLFGKFANRCWGMEPKSCAAKMVAMVTSSMLGHQ
ncbi:hypothetical protein PISMIDRAFT_687230 [Pisolithus microcarpus 441]|uniref:Uncharacterized protein n=1 Tax=Pisolithus microcarpus 441 TaxID=765257 RepID=A0A0C9YZM3_9AGAM|nr:hypothetical protein BKA83DRAFT_687230 [Pisolithus microcarpus]KIK15517.1 hypothetical protein PISMIDRAFT_687230 [Pisolithus microcarpus 441]